MDRLVSNAYAVTISAAQALYPDNLRPYLGCDFLTGTDPVFAGLHNFEDATYGRSMRDTAHCVYPFHQLVPRSRRRTTIVLPVPETVDTVVHELAHVLHGALGFDFSARPVSWYAETNRYEAFAEALTAWLVPGYAPDRDPDFEKRLLAT